MTIDAQQLQSLMDDHQMFHSDFQCDYLITARAGGTPYGCYKQALRELVKRYRGLKGLYADRELAQIDLEELEERGNGLKFFEKADYEKRRVAVRIAQKKMALEEINRTIRDTEREFRRFYGQAKALKEQIGELTPERRAELDREMWVHRLKSMAAVDLLTRRTLGQTTAEFIAAAPLGVRMELMREINGVAEDQRRLIEWLYCQPSKIPQATEAPCDVEKLLCHNPSE